MKIELISYSQPVTTDETVTDLVAYCARVSNPSNQDNKDTSEKLIRYLIKNQHWSPLEMVSMCLEIETTRDIARQILRHRSFSFQEFSQRYADPTKELNFVLREARLQDTKNRQNSIEMGATLKDSLIADEWKRKQVDIIRQVKESYEWAIANGTQKEHREIALKCAEVIAKVFPMASEFTE